MQRLFRLATALSFLLAALACLPAAAEDRLRIGSKRFTESYILAQLLAQTAAPGLTAAPEVKQGLGNTAIVYEALRSRSIDLYPEYAGTIALEILKSPEPMGLEAMNQALAPWAWARPLRWASTTAMRWRYARRMPSGWACAPSAIWRGTPN